jgi:Rieske Fe-S protein
MPGRLEPEPIARRDLLGLAGLWAAGAAIVGSIVGMMRLPKPSVLPEAGRRFRIGRPDEFPPGTTKLIPDQKVLVVAGTDGIAAISMVCPHLGCIVSKLGNDGFACPCHGSKFGKDGEVTGGPAPKALSWLEITKAVDGRLVVNSARQVEPGTYYGV